MLYSLTFYFFLRDVDASIAAKAQKAKEEESFADMTVAERNMQLQLMRDFENQKISKINAIEAQISQQKVLRDNPDGLSDELLRSFGLNDAEIAEQRLLLHTLGTKDAMRDFLNETSSGFLILVLFSIH
jgi:hypothetical protein